MYPFQVSAGHHKTFFWQNSEAGEVAIPQNSLSSSGSGLGAWARDYGKFMLSYCMIGCAFLRNNVCGEEDLHKWQAVQFWRQLHVLSNANKSDNLQIKI